MERLKELLKENSGLLSRTKERDRDDKLNKICEEIFKKGLTNPNLSATIYSEGKNERN